MPSPSHRTVPMTLRVFKEQQEALERLPDGISAAALVRVLLKLYLNGMIPQALSLARVEGARAIKAKYDGENQYTRKNTAA